MVLTLKLTLILDFIKRQIASKTLLTVLYAKIVVYVRAFRALVMAKGEI